MLLGDLTTDSVKILGLDYRYAASQIKQRVRQGLQDNLIASLYESDAVSFFEIQRATDRPGDGHLPSTSYSANDCHKYLHPSDISTIVSQLSLCPLDLRMSSGRRRDRRS